MRDPPELFHSPVKARSLVFLFCAGALMAEGELAEIITACGEAATNAIEHSGASGSSALELGGRVEGRIVELSLRDRGAWRTPREGERGRGMALMRGLMDRVEVTATPQGHYGADVPDGAWTLM